MKISLIPFVLILISSTLFAQQQTIVDPPQSKEYATVFLKIRLQGNTIVYDKTGLSRSPMITIPAGQQGILHDTKKVFSQEAKGELKDVGQVINYVATFGWTLTTTTYLYYDTEKKSANAILDFSEYSLLLTFERPYLSK